MKRDERRTSKAKRRTAKSRLPLAKPGFIVIGAQRQPLVLTNYSDGPEGGILLWGDTATVFATQRAARSAIERTAAYEREHAFRWDSDRCQIIPLVPFLHIAKGGAV